MKIVIVDAVQEDNVLLKEELVQLIPNLEEIQVAETIKTGCELIKKQLVNLVFLNIDLYEETSFKLLRKYKERNFEVVFMLEKSPDLESIFANKNLYYITKPLKKEAIKVVLNRIRAKMTAGLFGETVHLEKEKTSKRIALKERDGIRFIEINQIKRCKSDNNYTEIYLENGERILSTKTLKEYAMVLEPFGFYRVHQSHLVDLARIQKIVSKGGLFVQLKSEDLIELSRRRKDELLKRMDQMNC